MTYETRSARDAQSSGYGDQSYWDYLEQDAKDKRSYFLRKDDPETAATMMTRSLSEALAGNDGD